MFRLAGLLLLTIPVFAGTISFYSGDLDPSDPNSSGLANETDATVGGSPTGASTYQKFTVPIGGWVVSGLFSNDLMDFTPTSAYWEIRSGISEGNGGSLIASGTDNTPGFTASGRSGFGFTEYTVTADGLNIVLPAGDYWLTVTPQDASACCRSFNSNTFGLNAIGTVQMNTAFFNSGFFSANFTNANNEGIFPAFSAGVITESSVGDVPEPGSVSLVLVGGAALVFASWRRRKA